jgi:hypothetical protein
MKHLGKTKVKNTALSLSVLLLLRRDIYTHRMSKRELMQILEQQEWHDKSMWNENGTPINRVGSKRRRVEEEEEEEEGKEEEKEEEKARTRTTKEEEVYFECAGEGEEKRKDDEIREEDVAAMLRREIVNGFSNVLSKMAALEQKLDAIVANTTSIKK